VRVVDGASGLFIYASTLDMFVTVGVGGWCRTICEIPLCFWLHVQFIFLLQHIHLFPLLRLKVSSGVVSISVMTNMTHLASNSISTNARFVYTITQTPNYNKMSQSNEMVIILTGASRGTSPFSFILVSTFTAQTYQLSSIPPRLKTKHVLFLQERNFIFYNPVPKKIKPL
jgi:hypothetical protein